MLKVSFMIDPTHLSTVPFSYAKDIKVENELMISVKPAKIVAQGICYHRPKNLNYTVIDIESTLRGHNADLAQVMAKVWPKGTWQHAVRRSHLARKKS